MSRKATAVLTLSILLNMVAFPAKTYSTNEEYESLEFSLEQPPELTEDADKRAEILHRYFIKALGLA